MPSGRGVRLELSSRIQESPLATINQNYLRLKSSYLFSDIARRVREFSAAHPDAAVIRLGIGDVTRPLAGGAVKLLGLANRRHRTTRDTYLFRTLGGAQECQKDAEAAKPRSDEEAREMEEAEREGRSHSKGER